MGRGEAKARHALSGCVAAKGWGGCSFRGEPHPPPSVGASILLLWPCRKLLRACPVHFFVRHTLSSFVGSHFPSHQMVPNGSRKIQVFDFSLNLQLCAIGRLAGPTALGHHQGLRKLGICAGYASWNLQLRRKVASHDRRHNYPTRHEPRLPGVATALGRLQRLLRQSRRDSPARGNYASHMGKVPQSD